MIDGTAAAQTLLSRGSVSAGLCLFYVWLAYKAHGAATGRSAGTAYEAWGKSERRHPGDRNPPAGVPVWWGPKASSSAGDVVISLGGGQVVATDWPSWGRVGVTTIDARERQIGRPYLGWSECIFDVPILIPDTASDGSTPLPTPTNIEEITNMFPVLLNNTHQYLMGFGAISHLDQGDPSNTLSMKIAAPDDVWIKLDTAEFLRQCRNWGIPGYAVSTSTGFVLDPSTGKQRSGGVWSWSRVAAEKS